MKRLIWLAICVAPLCALDLRESELDRLSRAALEAWRVPGIAVAVVQGDRVVYLKGHGVRKLGAPEPVTPDSLFEIASTTKAFTTAALAMLVEEGKLAWDDPVHQHLDYFRLSDPLANANVIVRDLVSHRTGMPRHDSLWYKTAYSREEVIRRFAGTAPTKQFRGAYQYQNIQFLAAGELIGKVTGGTWDAFVKSRLLDPLGMTRTTSRYAEATAQTDRAMPHRRLDDGQNAAIDWVNFENVGGAGCLNSSARDLAQWLRLHLGKGAVAGRKLIGEKFLAETYEPHTPMLMDTRARELAPLTTQRTYALGWFIDHYRGQTLLTHGGALDGFRAQVMLDREHSLGIVVLANLGPTSLPTALAQSLLDHIVELPARDWNTEMMATLARHDAEDKKKKREREAKRARDVRPAKALAAYAGRYRAPGYGLLEVKHDAGRLTIECLTRTAPLDHRQHDTFAVPTGDPARPHPLGGEELVFQWNADAEVASVKFLNTEFRRTP
jgi:CubicO group peptidase (beta-lactamase class C family)